jgi:hypothetical protein
VISVEQVAPNMRAVRQISVLSGRVSRGMTLEKTMCTPASVCDRIRGMICYISDSQKTMGEEDNHRTHADVV